MSSHSGLCELAGGVANDTILRLGDGKVDGLCTRRGVEAEVSLNRIGRDKVGVDIDTAVGYEVAHHEWCKEVWVWSTGCNRRGIELAFRDLLVFRKEMSQERRGYTRRSRGCHLCSSDGS
jgi:hypothetical protein